MSESKMIYSVEETLRIQTVKLNQQLNKLLEQNTQIIELTAERDAALAQNADAFGDGYYDGFLDGAKHHESTDCNTHPTYLGDDAMHCSEIAEVEKSKRLGIVSRQELIAQNAELVAQVEALKHKGRRLVKQAERALDFDIGNYHALKGSAYALDDAIDATPTQHLRDIQAEAVRDFILWGTLRVDPEFAEFKDCAEVFIKQLGTFDGRAERVKAGEV